MYTAYVYCVYWMNFKKKIASKRKTIEKRIKFGFIVLTIVKNRKTKQKIKKNGFCKLFNLEKTFLFSAALGASWNTQI